MRRVKLLLVVLFVVLVGAVMHYALPRHDVVRIVEVNSRVEVLGWNRIFYSAVPAGTAEDDRRDVRFISTLRPSGRERVFRNEDTGWLWPPYFKLNSADLQTRAFDMRSTAEAPVWVAVTYYGVRSRVLSIYPNALRVRLVEGPEASVIPWTRIIGFALLLAAAAWIWVLLRRFRERRVEPFIDSLGDRSDRARSRFARWLERLRGR